MATIKSYTDIEQSKKLAKILPLESADMFYRNNGIDVKLMWEHNAPKVENPCWSLAALLDVLPNQTGRFYKTIGWFDGDWHCDYIDEDSECKYFSAPCDNPVDACVDMIEKLNELKLL